MSEQQATENIVDQAVAEGGAYEVIRKRLLTQGKQLKQQTLALNTARLEEFGSSEMAVAARVRVRTENNCVARDIVQVGDLLLFGYNVFIGLKKETRIEDVFSLFRLTKAKEGEQYEMEQQPITDSFLTGTSFANDFAEKKQRLFSYYLINELASGQKNLQKVYDTIRAKVKRQSLRKGLGYKQVPDFFGNTRKNIL